MLRTKAEYRIEHSCDLHAGSKYIDSLRLLGIFHFCPWYQTASNYTDVMLKIPTSCGCFADNESHGHDVDADVLLIGFADVHNQ